MFQFIKILLIVIVAGGFCYAGIVLFPRKLRLLSRIGDDKTYYDIKALAQGGDEEARRLMEDSRRLLWVILPCSALIPVAHAFVGR